jgi:GNAT superfamily N-acetyltransferase
MPARQFRAGLAVRLKGLALLPLERRRREGGLRSEFPLSPTGEPRVADLDVTVYYLEMRSVGAGPAALPVEGRLVLHALRPSVDYYRYLYNAVGKDYNWLSRRDMADDELATIIQNPLVELHVLHMNGSPAGFAELDRREPGEIELKQFGLMPGFIGRGLGKWFLQWTVHKAWSYAPQRFWLHTCSLDHPAAMPNYEKAGFQLYQTEQIRRKP